MEGVYGECAKNFELTSKTVEDLVLLHPDKTMSFVIELKATDGVVKASHGILIPGEANWVSTVTSSGAKVVTGKWLSQVGSKVIAGLFSAGSLVAWMLFDPTELGADMIYPEYEVCPGCEPEKNCPDIPLPPIIITYDNSSPSGFEGWDSENTS